MARAMSIGSRDNEPYLSGRRVPLGGGGRDMSLSPPKLFSFDILVFNVEHGKILEGRMRKLNDNFFIKLV